MRLSVVSKSKAKYCVHFKQTVTKKCGILLFLLTALTVTFYLYIPYLPPKVLPHEVHSVLKSDLESVLHFDIPSKLPEPPIQQVHFELTRKLQHEFSPPQLIDLPNNASVKLRPKTILLFNNKDLCTSNLPPTSFSTESKLRTVVIVILSARKHFMERHLIRQTYGSKRSMNNIQILAIVFMLGSSDEPGREQVDFKRLEAEREQFNDLIMGDFVDTYRNLTLKSIMAYEWLTTFCQQAQIVVKTDDDVLINVFKLTEELNALSPSQLHAPNFWCAVHYNETAITDVNSQFRILPNEFPHDIFPHHCAGLGYITNMGVIGRIINEISSSFLGRVSTHEDVFMTGVVPDRINSIANKSSNQNAQIKLINKWNEWISYDLNSKRSNNTEFLLNLIRQPSNETTNFDEFRKRFERKIFYLLSHEIFDECYLRFWQIIVQMNDGHN